VWKKIRKAGGKGEMHTYSYIAISYSTPEKEESAADPPFSLIPFFVPSGIRT
jgi:hypothetical protein